MLDLSKLVRTFTLRTSEGFVENFGPDLIARVGREAPGVRLRFVPKPDKDSAPLRDGSVDLETGVVGQTTGPELRAEALIPRPFRRRRAAGHALSQGEITPARYAAGSISCISQRGPTRVPSMKPWFRSGWKARSSRSSAVFRRRSLWRGLPI